MGAFLFLFLFLLLHLPPNAKNASPAPYYPSATSKPVVLVCQTSHPSLTSHSGPTQKKKQIVLLL
jgi:hypothetical protein